MLGEYEVHQALKKGKLQQLLDSALSEAPQPEEPTDEFFETLHRAHPDHWIFNDPITTKRLRDLLRDAQAAKATTPEEDARLRQTQPENMGDDEYIDGAEGAMKWNRTRKL